MALNETCFQVALPRWASINLDSYGDSLRLAGLEPVELSVETAAQLEHCRGLVLPGGVDVDPSFYGAPRRGTRESIAERDEFEIGLLRAALAADLPVLAICRGHQLLNVGFGGSLLQHIEGGAHEARAGEGRQESASHVVKLEASSRLDGVFAAGPNEVNSRHHQAVTGPSLAPGLRPLAVTEDGLIEAVESSSHRWVVGVQWHPERDEPQIRGFGEASRALFRAFASAVSCGS